MSNAAQQDRSTGFRQELRLQRRMVFGNRRYWFHVIIWVLVFLNFFFVSGELSQGLQAGMAEKNPVNPSFNLTNVSIGIISGAGVAAIIIYSFLLLSVPYARYKMQKRYLWIALFINGIFWTGILVTLALVLDQVEQRYHLTQESIVVFIGVFASLSVLLSAYFFAFYYFVDLYDQQKNLNRYEKVFTDKLQAETIFLKTQINPHFLFNTLNNIYSLTLSRSDDAPRITHQLKDLIGYMVNDCALDMVPLAGEVDFLRNYIALEKLRNRQDDILIELDIKGNMEGRQIAPLLLVNFIENAFKHGVKAGTGQSFVKVKLYVMNNLLQMEVSNSRPPDGGAKDLAVSQSGGIGIRNVKRRLEILYPNRYRLRINRTKTMYHVNLIINI